MNLQELLSLNIENKVVVIIGRPGAGKSFLSEKLDPEKQFTLFTDVYLHWLNKDESAAYVALVGDAAYYKEKWGKIIIEGMLCYNLLLKGHQHNSFKPDIIIDCVISTGKQREIYLAERNPEKLKWQKKFYEQKLTMLNEYFKLIQRLPESERPQFITYNNTFDAVEK